MTLFQRNRGLRRGLVSLLSLTASLLITSAAAAQSATPPPYPVGIGSPEAGYMVDGVNPAIRTITMAGETFRVTATSTMTDAKGNKISLRDVRGMASHGVADIVKFESRRIGGASNPAEIVSLQIVSLAP